MPVVTSMKLCSSCLLGIKCKYNGESNKNQKIIELSKTETLMACCPEYAGGLPTPRDPSEIVEGDGYDVLDGKAKVMTKNGIDVTSEFIKGANKTLEQAKTNNIKIAILKQRSPSCGSGQIYDGTFSGKIKTGDGVTTALLKRNNIKVLSEDSI